tara:strand:- start:411 stop:1322 length:912 start_codon:yes stop_codon:yes gene_type:complete
MDKLNLIMSEEVQDAITNKKPVVALESTLISHGLPYPENLNIALSSINAVRLKGSIPATIAIIEGKIKIGLNENDINILAKSKDIEKVSIHNLSISINNNTHAATTVASSIYLASLVGIKFFSTGGIGGVHLESEKTFDVSSDLNQLSKTKMNVICSGAKSILDISKTYEHLETLGIPRIGYNTKYMPGFWYYQTDKKVDYNYENIDNLVNYIKIQESHNLNCSTLIFNTAPKNSTIDKQTVDQWIKKSVYKAKELSIDGKKLTPFLINEINNLSKNKTLKVNSELIVNNASLASNIAAKYYC